MTTQAKILMRDISKVFATDEMEKLAASVKKVSASVKKGTATKSELNEEVEKLRDQGGKVKILTAEAKMFGGWTVGDENLPPPLVSKKILILISCIALLYLVKSS